MNVHGSPLLNERYRLIRQLGAGGMGVVYEAVDRNSGMPIALKTMRVASGDALLRFKTEFRALQDIHHPNLVTLHDLLEEDGAWWFSMELVRGVNFLAYVRAPINLARLPSGKSSADGAFAPTIPASAWEPTALPGSDFDPLSEQPSRVSAPSGTPRLTDAEAFLDEKKLRAATEQLVEGLHALHIAGKVHRDIKPENVLITEGGRVVILDFGLIGDFQQRDSGVVGTVTYMAPEQAAGLPVGPAADWYSVGVLLYEALTGCVPFEGTALQVLADKQTKVPASPASLIAGVPDELNALCMELLRTDPAERPDYQELVRRLKPAAHPPVAIEPSGNFFVGRLRELDALERVFQTTRNDHGQVVLLHGESGIGKSALMQQFVGELARRIPELMVLSGRCYEHEMVPFKAIDGVVDTLALALRRLPQETVAALLPRRVSLLRQVFPVLGLVPALADTRDASEVTPDPHEQRNRFFVAFRTLLGRIAEYRPLVILIEDLQWTDSDSLALLERLMAPPEEPPLLMVATVRSAAPVLKGSWLDPAKAQGFIHHQDINRLPTEEAIDLAERLLQLAPEKSPLNAQQLVQETSGHPLFLRALAYHAVSQGVTDAARLDDAVWDRVQKLPAPAQTLLHLAAVVSRPLSLELARQAGRIDAQELNVAVAQLRIGYLLRTSSQLGATRATGREVQTVEPYHDRVREIVVSRLSPAQQQALHRELALTLEQAAGADPEALAYHFEKADLADKAARYALEAADGAARALAFERAARFYRLTLQLKQHTADEKKVLYRRLGEVLAHSGRGGEAGDAYRQAAEVAQAMERRELQALAANQLIRSGRISDGAKLLRELLDALGLSYPETPSAAVLQLLWTRVRLRLRGLRYTERAADTLPPDELLRLDVCRAAAEALSIVDVARGALFRTQFFHFALQTGEPNRLAQGALLEASMVTAWGISEEPTAAPTLALARRLVERLNQPHPSAMLLLSEASIAHNLGRWLKGRELFDSAELEFRSRCTNIAWEIGTARFFSIRCSLQMGEFGRIAARMSADLQESAMHGDLYTEVCLRSSAVPRLCLAHGNMEEARRAIAEAEKLTGPTDYPLQQYFVAYSAVECDLYDARGQDGMARLQAELKHLKHHHLLRIQCLRITVTDMLGRCALLLAAQATGSDRRHWLKEASRTAAELEGEGVPWAQPLAKRHRASALALHGDLESACGLLASASAEFESVDMRIYAAAARYRQGQLQSGTQGQKLLDGAEARMRSEQIGHPGRYAAMLAPGFRAESRPD